MWLVRRRRYRAEEEDEEDGCTVNEVGRSPGYIRYCGRYLSLIFSNNETRE